MNTIQTIAATKMAESLDTLTLAIRNAVQTYERSGDKNNDFAYNKWKNTALSLLEADRLAAHKSIDNPALAESGRRIVEVARNELGLSKNLDTFNMEFAGEEAALSLNRAVYDTVSAASAVIEAFARIV